MIRTTFLLLAAVPLALPAADARTATPRSDEVGRTLCKLGFRAVQMRTARSGHHLAQVSVNGVAGTFAIDTGAGASVIHAPLVAQFQLRPQAGAVKGIAIGAGGSTAAAVLAPAGIRIADADLGERRLVSADLTPIVTGLKQLAGEDIQGIIGQDILRAEHAVVDVRQSMLYLQGGNRKGC